MRPTDNHSLPASTATDRIQRPRHISVVALLIALAAGVAEMIAHLWEAENLSGEGPAILLRLGIYAVVAGLILAFARGHRWAAAVLIVGLGVVGMASLIAEPLTWLFTDGDMGSLLATADASIVLIILIRTVHIAAVIVAVPLMIRILAITRRAR